MEKFDFYVIEAIPIESDSKLKCHFRLLENSSVEAPSEKAKETVNAKFQELVSSDPEIGIFVVCSKFGEDPPGYIVAVELIHAQTIGIRQRQGKPARELKWVTDESTGF
jgi:hypothetical protein